MDSITYARVRLPSFPTCRINTLCTLWTLLLQLPLQSPLALVVNADSVAPSRVRFAKHARSPMLDGDQTAVTIPMAGRARTPIHRHIKVAHKEVSIRPSSLKCVWTAKFGERRPMVVTRSLSFLFAKRQTADRAEKPSSALPKGHENTSRGCF
jgi:hypothetical protein